MDYYYEGEERQKQGRGWWYETSMIIINNGAYTSARDEVLYKTRESCACVREPADEKKNGKIHPRV